MQKTVWVDGGAGNDRITIASGTAILTDQSEGAGRNDLFATAAELFGPAVLIAPQTAPADGVLTADAQFHLVIDNLLQQDVTVAASRTDGSAEGTTANQSVADLIADLNIALDEAGILDRVRASEDAGRIVLSTTSAGAELATGNLRSARKRRRPAAGPSAAFSAAELSCRQRHRTA